MTKYNLLINQDNKQVKYENLKKTEYQNIIENYKKHYALSVERSFYFDSTDTYIIHVHARKYLEFLAVNF